jgi:hypothetical protein
MRVVLPGKMAEVRATQVKRIQYIQATMLLQVHVAMMSHYMQLGIY